MEERALRRRSVEKEIKGRRGEGIREQTGY